MNDYMSKCKYKLTLGSACSFLCAFNRLDTMVPMSTTGPFVTSNTLNKY